MHQFFIFFFGTRRPPRAQSREEKAGELLIGICGVMFDLSLPSLLEAESVGLGVSAHVRHSCLTRILPSAATFSLI